MSIQLFTNLAVYDTAEFSAAPGPAAAPLKSAADGGITLDHIHISNNAAAGSLTVIGFGVIVAAAAVLDQGVQTSAGPTFDHLHLTNDANVGANAKVAGGVTAGTYNTPSSGDVRASGGLAAGVDADPGNGNLEYAGNLSPYRNSTTYPGYIFVPLATPLTSTSWDGDAFSTTAKTVIDLSAVFGVPAGVKAIYARAYIRDSGSAGSTNAWLLLSNNNTAGSGSWAVFCCGLTNDAYAGHDGIVNCDANGDIYYQIMATGAGTMDITLQIWGYFF